MRHLVIGQRQKAPYFSAFHWSPHGCLITVGQHFVTTRVVHLPKRTETNLITKSDQSGPNHQLLQLCTARTAWSDSDQAVRAVHSCNSWFRHHSVLHDFISFEFRHASWSLSKSNNTLFFQNAIKIVLKVKYWSQNADPTGAGGEKMLIYWKKLPKQN